MRGLSSNHRDIPSQFQLSLAEVHSLAGELNVSSSIGALNSILEPCSMLIGIQLIKYWN